MTISQTVAQATGDEIEAMRRSREELGRRDAYMSTAEAISACAFEISQESLLLYPEWILPRIMKNPRAKRPSWLFDPRDIAALPAILSLWNRARANQREEEFRLDRLAEIEERDQLALARIAGRAA